MTDEYRCSNCKICLCGDSMEYSDERSVWICPGCGAELSSGWPPGYFERTAGSLADDPIERDSREG